MVVWTSLKDLGLSQKTIEEEDIVNIQYGGLFPMTKFYTFVVFLSYTLNLVLVSVLVVECFLKGETTLALESAHLLFISSNMVIQITVYHYYSWITRKLYRAINEGFFSYGDTMDDDSNRFIEQEAEKKRLRKKVLGDTFRILIAACAVGIQVKKPLLYLINGHGKRDVDGMDWLIYESPTGVYMPFSNYWPPYIMGMVISYATTFSVGATASASISCFLRFAEELLHQLYVIKLGLRNVISRANHLYDMRIAKDPSQRNKTQYDACLTECLNSSVIHHHLITELFGDFKKLMYLPLFTVIFDGGALICLATYLLSTTESLALRMSITPFIIGELYYTYIYCSYGERLTRAFADIGDQLYLNDFLEHSKLMKPYLITIHAYSLAPKRLSAAGFTSPNLQSFGNVLRTAYSLMNFLLAQK